MTYPLRIAFSDFPGTFNPTRIRRLLDSRFLIDWVERDPDYVIFSVFGHDYLDHADAVRIFFTGENVRPDFNLCDYAFGFDWMEFGDRKYRCPNFQLYEHFKEIARAGRTDPLPHVGAREFCDFIYTNGDGHPMRDACFRVLSEYRRVDSAGAHLNNLGWSPGKAYTDDWLGEKVAFQRGYKFSIAFENSTTPGYTTEKIVHALAAGTIPIYWGDPLVGRDFNEDRFINVHRYPSLEAVRERVIEIDRDDALYEEMVRQPFFPGGQVPEYLTDDAILRQFAHFEQPKAAAFRRNFHAWGARYEGRVRAEAAAAKARG